MHLETRVLQILSELHGCNAHQRACEQGATLRLTGVTKLQLTRLMSDVCGAVAPRWRYVRRVSHSCTSRAQCLMCVGEVATYTIMALAMFNLATCVSHDVTRVL